jgi:hypothetical protein
MSGWLVMQNAGSQGEMNQVTQQSYTYAQTKSLKLH